MSRNPDIEEILRLWWELEQSDPPFKERALKMFHNALDRTRGRCKDVSRNDLIEALSGHYKEIKRAKREEYIATINRLHRG